MVFIEKCHILNFFVIFANLRFLALRNSIGPNLRLGL